MPDPPVDVLLPGQHGREGAVNPPTLSGRGTFVDGGADQRMADRLDTRDVEHGHRFGAEQRQREQRAFLSRPHRG